MGPRFSGVARDPDNADRSAKESKVFRTHADIAGAFGHAARQPVMRNAFWIALSLAMASPLPAVAQNTANQAALADPVIRAMIDELERSMAQLKLNNVDNPYFIQYVVLEEEEYAASATFGALRQSSPSRQRLVNAQVRVGNYDIDNSEFAVGRGGVARPRLWQATLEDDYASFRHTLWLATDLAYKQAVETIAQKR